MTINVNFKKMAHNDCICARPRRTDFFILDADTSSMSAQRRTLFA